MTRCTNHITHIVPRQLTAFGSIEERLQIMIWMLWIMVLLTLLLGLLLMIVLLVRLLLVGLRLVLVACSALHLLVPITVTNSSTLSATPVKASAWVFAISVRCTLASIRVRT